MLSLVITMKLKDLDDEDVMNDSWMMATSEDFIGLRICFCLNITPFDKIDVIL